MSKYKLTLLKDLPDAKAGTEVLNISDEDLKLEYCKGLNSTQQEIFQLKDNAEWVKIEEDSRCDCLTKHRVSLLNKVAGYGMTTSVYINFVEKAIHTHHDCKCDCGHDTNISIKFCPFCGREL